MERSEAQAHTTYTDIQVSTREIAWRYLLVPLSVNPQTLSLDRTVY